MDGIALSSPHKPSRLDTGFADWLSQQQGRQYELHDKHVNPAFVKMLRTIGFDKGYVRGEGAYLWDAQGNKYLDLLTGWGVFALGRNHPKVKAVMKQILDQDLPNLVRMDCSLLSGLVAETLTRHTTDGLSRVFFCNSGTEAIETALKFARCVTGRQDVIFCDHAFHGLTDGLAVGQRGRLLPRTVRGSDAGHPQDSVQRHRGPGKGAFDQKGRRVHRRTGTRQKLRSGRRRLPGWKPSAYAKSTARLLVCDEVQCGLGRTGKWFTFQHWDGVEPDIVCVAKALSGGYVPVGARSSPSRRIFDGVFNSMERCVVHSNTFGQNDMAMAAALASLYVIEEDKLVENAAAMGDYMMSGLREIGKDCPFVADVRGKGVMFGIDFHRPKESFKLKMGWDMLHKMNFGVFGQMIIIPLLQKHRILTQVAGYHTEVIKFLPPMTITKADADWFLGAMRETLTDTTRFPGAAWDTVFGLAKRAMLA